MKNYELTLIISPDLSEPEIEDLGKEISAVFPKTEDSEPKTWNWSKPVPRKLGQNIKGKERAQVVGLNFQAEPEQITILEQKLKNCASILRYIVLAIKPASTRPAPPKRVPRSPEIQLEKEPEKKKVELKEIEQKLEEILKEI